MSINWLDWGMTLTLLTLLGCGESPATPGREAQGGSAGATTAAMGGAGGAAAGTGGTAGMAGSATAGMAGSATTAGAGGVAGLGGAFEIDGSWIYLGPSDVPHTLTISDSGMTFSAVAGDWSSAWTIKTYDNGLHHFQIAFGTGSGTYLPVGQAMSGSYELSGTLLTVQLAQGLTSYPALQDAGTCTGGADGAAVPDCRLYIKQN
jgi:hypothetical protein